MKKGSWSMSDAGSAFSDQGAIQGPAGGAVHHRPYFDPAGSCMNLRLSGLDKFIKMAHKHRERIGTKFLREKHRRIT